jgi:hypothetical protein
MLQELPYSRDVRRQMRRDFDDHVSPPVLQLYALSLADHRGQGNGRFGLTRKPRWK